MTPDQMERFVRLREAAKRTAEAEREAAKELADYVSSIAKGGASVTWFSPAQGMKSGVIVDVGRRFTHVVEGLYGPPYQISNEDIVFIAPRKEG